MHFLFDLPIPLKGNNRVAKCVLAKYTGISNEEDKTKKGKKAKKTMEIAMVCKTSAYT